MNTASSIGHLGASSFKEIFEQYVDNASFLWVLRSIAVNQPHYYPADIQELEQRINAQLDGLMTSIDAAWPLCSEALELAEPGEVFTAAVVAFRSHDMNKIQQVVEVGLSSEIAVKGLISALGWLPGKLVHSWIKKFFISKDLNHKYLAIAACSVRRENPEEYLTRILERDDCKEHLALYSRSLRLIGELRRLDLMPFLEAALNSEDDNIRFWAIWSSILLGKRDIIKGLEPYVFNPGPYQTLAINMAFRVLPLDQARVWISTLAKGDGQTRNVIKATGVLGDPHAVNWLISKMQDESVSRLAGEVFCLITGIDLEQYQLIDVSKSEQGGQDVDEIEDEAIELDEDENLPYPDYEKVKKLWMNHGRNFIAGQRYIFGKPLSSEHIKSRLFAASQRQLQASAMELSLIDSNIPMLNYKARVKGKYSR
jgi:uncharacterized protein (TIGR02270 family)